MKNICKNCSHHFEGKFCSNCGQTVDTSRLDFHFLRHKFVKLIFKYFDDGIFYTSKELFTRPGNSIRGYIEGKRVNHFEPIALLVTLSTLYGLLFKYFRISLFTDDAVSIQSTFGTIQYAEINDYIASHYSLFTIVFLPFISLASYIVFRKQGYNFVEHFILNTFLACQKVLIRLATFPFLVHFNHRDDIFKLFDVLVGLDIILMVWGYCQFFNKIKIIKSLFLTLISYLLFFIIYLLILAMLTLN